jgi:membrane-bound lytic murein transglycosylase A
LRPENIVHQMMNTKMRSAPNASSKSKVMPALHHCLLLLLLAAGSAGAETKAISRWTAVSWSELPAWGSDDAQTLWPALRSSCERPTPAWRAWCQQLLRQAAPSDALQWHAWLMQTLQPYRIETHDASPEGLMTGYFEPQLVGRRLPDARFSVPLLDTQQRHLLYLDDALDAVLLQIQGSGRVRVTEPNGSERERRVAWAGHNGQPFRSLGRWLIEQGGLRDGLASWSAIRAWALQNPERLPELLAANPRTIFFREEALPNPHVGPRGAQGLPLTPGRSVAVDPLAVPYGTLLWLDSTQPNSKQPLQRLVLAQDTGSAILGAVRADFFWGWGEQALPLAGRTKQGLRWWALWPKNSVPMHRR